MTPKLKLFALGSNGSGQLGIGHQEDVSTPQPCLFEDSWYKMLNSYDKIVKVVAGGNHTLVRFASGQVFAAGSNEYGQCGLLPKIEQTSIFRMVSLQSGSPDDSDFDEDAFFDDIAATWDASFFTVGNFIYVRGRGTKGELGLGRNVFQALQTTGPIKLSTILGLSTMIKDIKSCMSHTVVLTNNGQLLGWGAGRKGQLGAEGKVEKAIWEPQVIAGMPLGAEKIALGRQFTFVAGEKERWHYLLGESKYEDTYLPDLKTFALTDGEEDYLLIASWSNIYALPPDQRLRGWGRNDRGQLPPEQLPKLKAVAAGSEHCVGLTVEGGVVAWGWGEHGNCGPDTDAHANVADRWNVLPIELAASEEVVGVAAGCATSFIICGER